MKITRRQLRSLIIEQITSNMRNKGSWKKWVSEDDEDDMNEVQGMTKNPFSAAEPAENPITPQPVVNGSCITDGDHNDAVAVFMKQNDFEVGDYHIVCSPGPGNTWACIASVSNIPMTDSSKYDDGNKSALNDPNKSPWED